MSKVTPIDRERISIEFKEILVGLAFAAVFCGLIFYLHGPISNDPKDKNEKLLFVILEIVAAVVGALVTVIYKLVVIGESLKKHTVPALQATVSIDSICRQDVLPALKATRTIDHICQLVHKWGELPDVMLKLRGVTEEVEKMLLHGEVNYHLREEAYRGDVAMLEKMKAEETFKSICLVYGETIKMRQQLNDQEFKFYIRAQKQFCGRKGTVRRIYVIEEEKTVKETIFWNHCLDLSRTEGLEVKIIVLEDLSDERKDQLRKADFVMFGDRRVSFASKGLMPTIVDFPVVSTNEPSRVETYGGLWEKYWLDIAQPLSVWENNGTA